MKIYELLGEAYNEAIAEVMNILNDELGSDLTSLRMSDTNAVHEICLGLNIEFTSDGEIE